MSDPNRWRDTRWSYPQTGVPIEWLGPNSDEPIAGTVYGVRWCMSWNDVYIYYTPSHWRPAPEKV